MQVPDPKSLQPKPIVVPTKQIITGFTASSARAGEDVKVEVCGLHTFDEGIQFYHMLEGFDEYVRRCSLMESSVDRMLVCISKKETQIYVNNTLPYIAMMRPKRSIKAGEGIIKDDVAGIERLEFPGVHAPENAGFLLLISAGWRRGMCFDFSPLMPETEETSAQAFDRVKHMGGMVLAHLWFTEKFLLSEQDWRKVLDAGWFPFIFLPNDLWQQLHTAICNGWELSANEQNIHEKWIESCDTRLESWKANTYFKSHIEFLERAIRAYKELDWITVVSVATPRVEGLLRMAFGEWGKQKELLDKVVNEVGGREHSRSLLFPERLKQYFEEVIFRSTPFSDADVPSTRHTLSHGMVPAEKLTRKEALTLLLLIDHILYCVPLPPNAKRASPF